MSLNPVREVTQFALVPAHLHHLFALDVLNRNRAAADTLVPTTGLPSSDATPPPSSSPVGDMDDSDEEDGDYSPSESGSNESDTDTDMDTDNEDDGAALEEDSVLFVGGPIHPMLKADGTRLSPGTYAEPVFPVQTAYDFVETVGPFIAGTAYGVVPDYMRFNPYLDADEYFVIAKGKFVGIVTCPIVADAATDGCSSNLRAKATNQTAAVNKFNVLLSMGLVSVV